MQKTKGFTLLELLVVIVIIGILTSIALPSYQHYLKKSRFTEVMMATQPYKTAIALALQDGDVITTLNNGAFGIPLPPKTTKNLASLSVKAGIISATATKSAGAYTYILTPSADGTEWQVSGTCKAAGVCRG